MLSEMDMTDIIAEPDRKKREVMIDGLSGEDAKQMLKSLTGVMRRMHDTAREQGGRRQQTPPRYRNSDIGKWKEK